MRRILQPFRLIAVAITIGLFLLHMGVVWLFVRTRWRRIAIANRILSFYSRMSLKIFNVRVRALDMHHHEGLANALFVGNHLSYIDVLVLASVRPCCFVTSVEIKNTPGLGTICKMAGSLFVERRSRTSLLKEVEELTEGLRQGLNVTIFPEATSTSGESILRFRRPLYISAMQSGSMIVPFCLNYHTVGGRPINKVTRDSIFYYGKMDFAPHLWALCGSGGIDVDLHFLTPLSSAGVNDPAELALKSQTAIETVFRPVINDGP